MKTLDLQLKVARYSAFDHLTWHRLMDEGTLQPLSHSLTKKIFGQIIVGDNVLRARYRATVIIITDDGLVWIQGPNWLDCVSALCVLISLLYDVVGAPVSIELLPADTNGNSLHHHLARESVLTGVKRLLVWGLGSALTICASAVLGWWLAERIG